MTRDDAIGLLLAIAETDVGKREESRNRAPWIAKLWTATSYPDGMKNREPYCAAGMCWVLREWIEQLAAKGELKKTLGMTRAEAERWRCKDARAFGWRDWAVKRGVLMIPDTGTPEPGDFVVYDFSHIGLVEDADPTRIGTSEYNTNKDGSREGDGCWRKVRPKSLAQCFIRVLP